MFVVLEGEGHIFKIAQLAPYPLKPRMLANSCKYFLSNGSQQLSAAILNKFPQIACNKPLVM